MPEQKPTLYEGSLHRLLTSKILINIDFIERGNYELQIIYKGKIIKRVDFSKP